VPGLICVYVCGLICVYVYVWVYIYMCVYDEPDYEGVWVNVYKY